MAYSLLSLSIDNLTDNSVPSIWAPDGGTGDSDDDCPVAMPMWRTLGLQLAIMRSLIQTGADINAGGVASPIRVAIASCHRAAFDLLMSQPGIQLQGRWVMQLPRTLPTDQPTRESEATLLSFYRQLVQRDGSLATETDSGTGTSPLHVAAIVHPVWSQEFIESYIDLLVANGADITATDHMGATPLHHAAARGSHCVAASLCRRLAAADVNRGLPSDPHPLTPLGFAARSLGKAIHQLRGDNTGQAVRDRLTVRIPNVKTTIRVLLQAGADIAPMPTATESDRRCRKLVIAERPAAPNGLPITNTEATQELLQKLKEQRDRHKRRQATREAKEAPTAADLARQQREADTKMAALIREEEAANKKEEAAKAKGGKKKGKGGKGQHSATSTITPTSSPPGGEEDQADSTGAANDDQPASNEEDSDALLLGSAFAQRAVESHKQTNPVKAQPAAHTKGSTHPPFSPFQPPTAKQKATLRPSADNSPFQTHDRPMLSRPSDMSTADQTPREERLMGPSLRSRASRPSGNRLCHRVPLTRPHPLRPSRLHRNRREVPMMRSRLWHMRHSSLTTCFPYRRVRIVRRVTGALRHSRVESVAEEGVEHYAGSDVEDGCADGEDTDTRQRVPVASQSSDRLGSADSKGTRRPNRNKPSSHSSGVAAAAASASPPSFGPADDTHYPEQQAQDDREEDEQHDAQIQMAILASLHEATASLSSGGHASGTSAAAAASLGPLQDAVSRAILPSSSSVDRPSCHRGPPPLVKCPRSFGASLSQNEPRSSQSYELRSVFDASPSSSSYDHPSATPAAPAAAAAAAATPYEEPLGPLDDDEGGQGASAAAAGVDDSVEVSSREAELQRKNDELARRLKETERRLAQMSIQQHQPSSSSSLSAPLPRQQPPATAAPGSGPARGRWAHLRLCRQCYDDRCSKLRRDLQQVRAENARRREENEGIKRKNEGRKKEKKIPLVELLDEPEYLCEQCKTKVVFAGSRDEVRQWADQPIT
ncbi:unnamed protein product [Vitrella brassicaformis CCMP3155]|uniref:Uncharacterized protein n=1 Tax=Vitrella brassicaformis (strain CCMP3155) TaxID=1169540 RepID=A0A0G4GZ51_VITBC|nr:unnamed protein product [Vitrella brassicaformis CCMP3155]|eukprot:CEM36495.1 unnamed protein product [Vitrella brassicaformis CCMP3155]